MSVKPDEPYLRVDFTYNHASGLYTAHLENGATFSLDRATIQGRLQNALMLFAKAVVATEGGKWKKPLPKGELKYSYSETNVRRYSRHGEPLLPKLDLDDLNLEIEL